jgi:hypothetical protein
MTVATTSLLAYKKINRKLGAEQMKVYKALKKLGESTDLEVADYLRKEINTVTPRRNELAQYGYVKEVGRRMNRTNNTAKAWVAVNPNFERIIKLIKKEAEVVDCY